MTIVPVGPDSAYHDFLRSASCFSKDQSILKQLVSEIPWGQNIPIMHRVKDTEARRYYLEAPTRYGGTGNALLNNCKYLHKENDS